MKNGPKKREPLVPDPTEAEIEERCKEIQEGWDEETRISRTADPKLLPISYYQWSLPVIKTADLPIDIYSDDAFGEDEDFENFLKAVKGK